ncbi:fatty acid synthase-like, partial [Ceratina calcarata]|uniref:Fatty acid synthase-like n=1 Tax=Ceratina calcarata TaxID=156304 RepID=A0AAJ7ITN8_9HYME
VRCLGYRGRFLEIGKFDLASNNKLGMEIFLKEITFHGVLLDGVIGGMSPVLREEMYNFLNKQLKDRAKAINPLVRKTFQTDQLEEAFRYMAAGKHI